MQKTMVFGEKIVRICEKSEENSESCFIHKTMSS